ncbi:hypothetical protein BD410DRAFT_902183 [Rickenella mellea]|uniref:Uncharacterized protein n=1 Tax=Rickenella mellea TaxID=50990 RepID=A0A4Y7PLY2_9AGAM|nr:hypothetical protein BD410DRAFT_902183 [Rickenella mellea]
MPSRRTASVRLSPQEVVRRNAEASTSSNEAETDLRPSVLDDFWYRLEGNHGGVKVRRQHEGRKPVPSLLRNSIVEDDSVDFVQGTNSDENPSRSVSSTIRYLDKGTDATNTGSWSELPNAHPVQGRLDYFASYALSSIPTTAPAVDDVSHTQNFDHIEPPGIESSRFVEDFGDFSPTALAVAVDQKLMYLNVGGSLSTLDLTGTPEENPEPVAEVLSPKCPEDDGDDEFDSLHRTMKTVERGLCQDIEWSSLRPSTSGTNEVSDVPRDTPDEPDASARIPGITISPPSPPSPTIPPIPPRSPLRHRRTPSIESDNETNELDMMRHKVNVLERKFSEVKVALGVQQDITVAVEREAQTVAVIVADLRKVNEDKDREIASLKAELAKLRRINSDFIRAVKEAGMANCALQDENDSLRIQRESYASMHGRNFTERMTNTAISVSPASKISSRSSTPPPPLMPSWTNVYKTPPRTPSKKLIVHVPSDAERLADDTLQSESRAQVPSDRTDGYALLTPEATPIRIRRRSASLDLRADAQHAEPRVRFAAMRPDKNSPNNLNCSTNDDEEYDSDETTAYEHNGVGRNDKRP